MPHSFTQEHQIILAEILSRLPVKSLCRFTSVSKSWYQLITSSSFISKHLNYNDINQHDRSILIRHYVSCGTEHFIMIQDSGNHVASLQASTSAINFLHKSRKGCYRIGGSCKGLLCFVPDFFARVHTVVLWNPSIQKSIILPEPIVRPSWGYIAVSGFGVDSGSGDFKVVRVVYAKRNVYLQAPEAEVYSLKKNTWRRILEPNVKVRIMQFTWTPVILNGCPHWLAYQRKEDCVRNLILTFDMSGEVFREIMVPDNLQKGNQVKLCCNLFRENLTIVKYHIGQNVGSCSIWVMKEYGVVESWMPLYTFNLIGGMERVIGFMEDGEVLVSRGRNELVLYNKKTDSIRDLGVSGFASSFYVTRYMESLVLLKNGFLEESI